MLGKERAVNLVHVFIVAENPPPCSLFFFFTSLPVSSSKCEVFVTLGECLNENYLKTVKLRFLG